MERELILIDDDEGFECLYSYHFEKIIKSLSLQTTFFKSSIKAMEYLKANSFDNKELVVISDYFIPEISGSEIVNFIKNKKPNTLAIIVSGKAMTKNIQKTEDAFFKKPLDFEALGLKIISGYTKM